MRVTEAGSREMVMRFDRVPLELDTRICQESDNSPNSLAAKPVSDL